MANQYTRMDVTVLSIQWDHELKTSHEIFRCFFLFFSASTHESINNGLVSKEMLR